MNREELIGWAATACLIIATTVRAFDVSRTTDLLMTLLGCGLWAYNAIFMKNASLFVVNAFSVIVIVVGFILI